MQRFKSGSEATTCGVHHPHVLWPWVETLQLFPLLQNRVRTYHPDLCVRVTQSHLSNQSSTWAHSRRLTNASCCCWCYRIDQYWVDAGDKAEADTKHFHILPNQRRNKTILEVWKSSGTIFTSLNSEKAPALIPKISPCGQVHTHKGLYLPGHSPAGPAGLNTPGKAKLGKKKKKKAFSAFEKQEQKKSHFPPFHTLKSKSTLAVQKFIFAFLLL